MNASSSSWPSPLERALYDVWGHTEHTADTMRATLEHFAKRWGGLDAEALQRALNGNDDDRLFALFALGYLAPSPMTASVLPFLDSFLPKERWASTITLGRWKQEDVLPALIKLLQEGLDFPPPVDLSFSGEGACSRWDLEDAKYQQDYEWYRIQRQQVTMIVASWNHPLVIPALIQAFDACYHLETHSPALKTHPYLGRDWYTWQDCLAYALGQQGAWDAPDRLTLPPARLPIVRMFLIYGALHAKALHVMAGMWYLSYEEMGIENPEHIDDLLQKHFHLSPEACSTSYRDFFHSCTERENRYMLY